MADYDTLKTPYWDRSDFVLVQKAFASHTIPVKSVEIRHNNYIHVQHIAVYSMESGGKECISDLDHGATATSKSMYTREDGHEHSPELACNGIIAPDEGAGNFFHSEKSDEEWLRIDFEKPYGISHIRIYNRPHDSVTHRLHGAQLVCRDENNEVIPGRVWCLLGSRVQNIFCQYKLCNRIRFIQFYKELCMSQIYAWTIKNGENAASLELGAVSNSSSVLKGMEGNNAIDGKMDHEKMNCMHTDLGGGDKIPELNVVLTQNDEGGHWLRQIEVWNRRGPGMQFTHHRLEGTCVQLFKDEEVLPGGEFVLKGVLAQNICLMEPQVIVHKLSGEHNPSQQLE